MLSDDTRTNIMAYADQFLGNAVIGKNEELCRGVVCNYPCERVAKVYILKQTITKLEPLVGTTTSDVTDENIDNLYRRLQCLIELIVPSS